MILLGYNRFPMAEEQQILNPRIRIRVGAKAFIVHEGKILLISEQLHNGDVTTHGQGNEILHDFPGGGVELGETLHEALKREVMEEVGLAVEVDRPVGSWDFFREMEDETVHLVCVVFQCHVVGDVAIDTTKNPAEEDIFETRWVSKEELLNSPHLFLEPEAILGSLENVTIE